MSRIVAAGSFIGVILMSTATLRASRAAAPAGRRSVSCAEEPAFDGPLITGATGYIGGRL
jgi:hypothetical protein